MHLYNKFISQYNKFYNYKFHPAKFEKLLFFESLAPNEHFGLEIVTFNTEIPIIVTLRSHECVAENIKMYPQPFVAKWKIRIAQGLMFTGLGVVTYFLILGIQFIVLKTPFGIYNQ